MNKFLTTLLLGVLTVNAYAMPKDDNSPKSSVLPVVHSEQAVHLYDYETPDGK